MIRRPTRTIVDIEAQETMSMKEDKRAQPKSFVVELLSNGLLAVKWTAGGEVPALLKGSYTSRAKAEQAADSYLLKTHASPKS